MMKTLNAMVFAACLCGSSSLGIGAEDVANPAIQPAGNSFSVWQSRHRQIMDSVKTPADVVFLGDSITDAWSEKEWNEFFGGLRPANYGIWGDKTQGILWRIDQGLFDYVRPRVVVLLIGTNNLQGRQNLPPADVAEGIAAVVDETLARLPDAKVLLLGIFPRTPTMPWLGARIKQTNRMIRKLARNPRVYFMDIGHLFCDEHGAVKAETMPDYLHPNATGYRVWAEAMVDELRRLGGFDCQGETAGRAFASCYPPLAWDMAQDPAWAHELPAQKVSGIAVTGQRTYYSAESEVSTLNCIDSRTGTNVWSLAVDMPTASGTGLTPVVWGGRIVAAWSDGAIVCADESGTVLWRADVSDAVLNTLRMVTVVPEGVLACMQSSICLLDHADGAPLWRTRISSKAVRPVVGSSFGRTQIYCPGYGFVRTQDGSRVSRGMADVAVQHAGWHAGSLFAAVRVDDALQVARYQMTSATGDCTSAWSTPLGGEVESVLSAPLVVGKKVYVLGSNGGVTVFDARSGELVKDGPVLAVPDEGAQRKGDMWATAEHLYVRLSSDNRVQRRVFSLQSLEPVWAYYTAGHDTGDAIGEFTHVVRSGTRLLCFKGYPRTKPEPPPACFSLAPSDTAMDAAIPSTTFAYDQAITNWQVALVTNEASGVTFRPLGGNGIWTHERFTAGMPSLDLTAICDKTLKVTMIFRTRLVVKGPVDATWVLLSPGGDKWNRADQFAGRFRLGGRAIAEGDVMSFKPGEYELRLEIEREPFLQNGKLWAAPRFVAAAEPSRRAAVRAAYEQALQNGKAYRERLSVNLKVE